MKYLTLLVGAVWLAGCAGMATTGSSGACGDDVACVISSAEAAVKKAGSVGAAWRDSDSLIKNAKDAEKAGDGKKAIQLATRAEREGLLAYEQGVAQKDAKPWQW
ncbi:MAG: hypothetical protein AABY83_03750 [Pseudomonadota bacterium]